jgi:hypothetical protein
METKTEIKKLEFSEPFAIYIPATILMYCMTKCLMPYLSEKTGQKLILF